MLCSSSRPCFVSIPALRSSSLVFLLLHVLPRHPLPPLCQPLASGAVFPYSEAAAMVARVAFWRVKDRKQGHNSHWCICSWDSAEEELVKQTSLPQRSHTLTSLTSLPATCWRHSQSQTGPGKAGRGGEYKSLGDGASGGRRTGGEARS